ncbi:hypothetical protein OIU79_024033 [Salix purpurea]|uniref:Uncharacterized protein n=1 Tax=Salix purpurea TaxID=77065 RepID=A0A9Q0WCW2_SALPP|nr:hypothetical protein OIU79_024033 [Salix purpurea]
MELFGQFKMLLCRLMLRYSLGFCLEILKEQNGVFCLRGGFHCEVSLLSPGEILIDACYYPMYN